jgi:RHS repeat-associated protein
MVPGLGVTYDAAGNETNDGTTAYTYDSENRIITATNSANGASSYLYDADGRRIRKTTTAGGTVDFLYDLGGHEITQVTSAGAWNRGEIYAGGRHLGTYTGGTGGNTYFTFADWLGTERARSTSTGGPYETCTSLPFGDWLTCTGGDPSPMHLTGKERDTETGLDNFGARYDSSQYGRFMTPDWAAKPSSVPYAVFNNPQSLNLYAYVQNNPVKNKDPDGHWCLFGKWGTTCQPPPPPPPQLPQSAGQAYANVHKMFSGNRTDPQAAGTAALIGLGGAAANAVPSVQAGVSSTVMGVTVSSDGTTSATNTVVGASVDLSVTRQGASDSTTEVSTGLSKHTSAGVLVDSNTGEPVGGAAHLGVGIGPPVTVSTTVGRTSDILSDILSGIKSVVTSPPLDTRSTGELFNGPGQLVALP